LARRAADAHKGDFGHVLIVGGSRGMAGAIALTGQAALRSGAGRVTLAVPDVCLDVVASFEPSYMTYGLPADKEGRLKLQASDALDELLTRATCVAIGPGLGRSSGVTRVVEKLYTTLHVPMVVDADGLNALAERGVPAAAGARILTPHPGEFRRLCPRAPRERGDMEETAIRWAAKTAVVLVLKGHRSLITDGRHVAHNTTGNPGMATGGTGDVLTGVLAGLLGQGLQPLAAATLGAFVHGRAGDLAAAELGEVSLIASDLLRFLARAFHELEN
jgi:NAD(P)H-hydrate epimerase